MQKSDVELSRQDQTQLDRTSESNKTEAVLSVRFEVGVSFLLAPVGADKRGLKAPFPLVENA